MAEFTTEDYLWDDVPLRGLCGHCQVQVDSIDLNHRVTSIVRGGRGVECVLRGDIGPREGGPLALRWEEEKLPGGGTFIRATHDGPHVFVDGGCRCGVLDVGVRRD